jgi:glycolate oxidase FAD binding subunit
VDEVAALMRQASEFDLAVSAWGGGAQRCLGNPLSRLDLVISLERLNQLLEYYPSDMTVAFQAGCSLQAANEALQANRQMLPLDAPLASQTTLGGIVATGPFATGLRRLAYGTVRDMLLGIQVVRADGRITRRGGMVVKNVAGYDMSRLQYGALGTLGIITQLNLKLFPQPENSRAILANLAELSQAGQVVNQLMSSRLQPATIAVFDARLTSQLNLGQEQPYWLLVRFDGREAAVKRQFNDTKGWLSAVEPQEIISWDETILATNWPVLVDFAQLADVEEDEILLRINVMPSGVVTALQYLKSTIKDMTCLVDAGCGVIWLRSSLVNIKSEVDAIRQRYPQTVVASGAKSQLKVWGATTIAADLMGQIKGRFNPHNLLNPGRFVV